ncbi:MAG: glycosyltransferase [Cyclobacteriaceae bacterium]|nr:glycosyltransferase [Cyclobacteriaceae bacterium]
MTEQPPLLSVCLITYNHAKFIRQAIDSVLMQQVNFTWELIIADDYSTDGTREILLEYKRKHPEFIQLILQEKNVGPAQNWLDLITKPKSKYIAYLEGDDYWTDPLKLQKQVDFLETNTGFAFCATKVCKLQENRLEFINYEKLIFDGYQLLKKNEITPSSTVFHRKYLSFINKNFLMNFYHGDWIFYVFLLKASGCNGIIMDFHGTVYRKHGNGLISAASFTTLLRSRIHDRLYFASRTNNMHERKIIIFSLGRTIAKYFLNSFRDINYLKAILENLNSIFYYFRFFLKNFFNILQH